MSTWEVPPVELHTDGTMVCGELKARPLKLPVRRVYKDNPQQMAIQVCDVGNLGNAFNFCALIAVLTTFDLLCLAALVDEVGR